VYSVAKTSKVSLPHHISLTKNGLSKRKETRFSFLVPKGKDRRQTHTILELRKMSNLQVAGCGLQVAG
jgi:hypothetical protein